MSAPDYQTLPHLALANQARLARSALKQRIRAGETTVEAVLVNIPPEARTMTVHALLASQFRWGTTPGRDGRASIFLRRLRISESRTLIALTVRERALLAAALAQPEMTEFLGAEAWAR